MRLYTLPLILVTLLHTYQFATAAQFKSGVIPPTEEEVAAFEAKYAMPPVPLEVSLPSRLVNSTYLPPVANGNQGQVGICGSICITYFTATHQLAKARGWQAPGHNGDWSRVTSPAWGVWCYQHNTQNNVPWGANPFETIEEIIRSGIRSWEDYPYTGASLDFTYMPDFNERAAALCWRAQTAVSISNINTPSGIHSLKYFLSQGNIAATSTRYVDVLRDYNGPNVQPNGVVIDPGEAEYPGHAVTIVGYDDTIAYTDPATGAIKQGAFLIVNSWGADWGYSVPEVGSGGFLWIPYELNFLNGAYSLNFTAEDRKPELYAKYSVVDSDGNWNSSAVYNAKWYDICDVEVPGTTERLKLKPVINDYSANTNRYVRAFDAGELLNRDFPAITFAILSSAKESAPEGEIEFALYDLPDDSQSALIERNIPVWGVFPQRRKVSVSPLEEKKLTPGLAVKSGGTAVADLNGDGADEFVLSYLEEIGGNSLSGAKRFVVARNDGSGNFTYDSLPGDGEHCGQPLLVDLNNNGHLDLVHSTALRTDILFNNGNGNFTLYNQVLPAGGSGGGAAVADFNRDGRPDLLLANADEGLLLMQQLPDGSFKKRALGRFTPNAMLLLENTCIATGDINGDGLPDFVFWERSEQDAYAGRLVVAINLGDFEFSYRLLPTPSRLSCVTFALGDFDQDGCDDLAWSGSGYLGNSYIATPHIGIFRGSPSGWMQEVAITPEIEPVFGGGITWADLNGDGVLELIVSGRESDIPSVFPTIYPTVEEADQGYYRTHSYLLHYNNGYFVDSGFNLTGVSGSYRSGVLLSLDMDGSGALDLISAGYRGPISSTGTSTINTDLYFATSYKNSFNAFISSSGSQMSPTPPTQFTATPGVNEMSFSWTGASGGEVAETGLRYQLQVGTASGNYNLLSGVLDPRNCSLLQRSSARLANVPAGNLYWRVRTLNSEYQASPWSAEQSVTMPTTMSRARVQIASATGGVTTPEAGEHLIATGGNVSLSAQPAPGWKFDGWLINGSSVSSNPYKFKLDSAWTDVIPQYSEKPMLNPVVGEWKRESVSKSGNNTFGFTDYAAVVYNNYLYCFPGYGSGQQTWRKKAGSTSWARNDFMGEKGRGAPYADAIVWNSKVWLTHESDVYSAIQTGSSGLLSWSIETTSAPWGVLNMELAVFNNKLWAVSGYNFLANNAGSVWSSTDGINWSEETTAPWRNNIYKRIVSTGDALVVITSTSSRGTYPGEVWGSTDGVNWTMRCAATPWEHDGSSWSSSCFMAAAWFDGAIHVVGQPNNHFASWDGGMTWSKVHPTGTESTHFTTASSYGSELVIYNNKLYLIGDEVEGSKSYIWSLAAASGSGPAMYNCSISVSSEGGTTTPPAGNWFDKAGSYPVVAHPEPGYEFVSWSGPVADPAAASTTIQLNANVAVVASFQKQGDNLTEPEPVPIEIIISPPNSGRVGPANNPNDPQPLTEVLADGTTEVIAIAGAGWEFSHWHGGVAKQMLSARTAVQPAEAGTVELIACFRPRSSAKVMARGNTSGFKDNSGHQWLWGENRFGLHEHLWSAPDGGVSPVAFDAVNFYAGVTPKFELGNDGSLRQSGGLRHLQHRFVQVTSAGSGDWVYTLAIDADGRVWSWGNNAYGQLGDNTMNDRAEPGPVLLPAWENFVAISAGETFAMALSLTGKVYVWGANSSGQTGDNGLINQMPIQVQGLPPIQSIAAGSDHAVALGGDGLVYGWGANMYGQSAGRRGDALATPAAIEQLTADMQSQHISFRTSDSAGTPLWDGGGTTMPQSEAVIRNHAEFYVAAEDGERYCFDHWEGPVVDPDEAQSTARAIDSAAVTAVFILKSERRTKLNLSVSHSNAALISPELGITEYAPGEQIELTTHPYPEWQFEYWEINGEAVSNAVVTLTMDYDVNAKAFYSMREFRTTPIPGLLNTWGQPADYDFYSHSIVDPNYTGPLFVDAAKTIFGSYSKLYLAVDGTLWYVTSVPNFMERVTGESAEIPWFGNVKKIIASPDGFILAIRGDDTVWVWGDVPSYANIIERPMQVVGLNAADYQQITAAAGAIYFLHNNGRVYSWSSNTKMTGTGRVHWTPSPVPGLTDVVQLAGNRNSVTILRSNGTVWGWGDNYDELLGVPQSQLNEGIIPVQVPGLTNITTLFPNGFARDTQGQIWVWGRDHNGDKGVGVDFLNLSILPPIVHSSFPENAVSVVIDDYIGVVCEDGSIWRAGNRWVSGFTQIDTEYQISDRLENPVIYRHLVIEAEPEVAEWISHQPGVQVCMHNDQVLLWANPPITVECNGWLINGQLVSESAINLLLDRDYTVKPLFSQRSKTQLPPPELCVGSVVVDHSQQGEVVRLPITLRSQEYIAPEALQFTIQVPGVLPEPELNLPDQWSGQLDLIKESVVAGTNSDWQVKVVLRGLNELVAVSDMTLATLNINLKDTEPGEYEINILQTQPVVMPVAAADQGAVAIPLKTTDGMIQLKASEHCALKLHLSPYPTLDNTLSSAEMDALSGYNSLRQDISRYAEIWVQCSANEELMALSYDLSLTGSALFATNQQYFINESDQSAVVSPDNRTISSMGGPISDEKIITYNDFANTRYSPGRWMLVARMPLGGSSGTSTIALTDIHVDLFQQGNIRTLVLPDQNHPLTVIPNAAPTSANLAVSTSSSEFVRIQPEINDPNPQDTKGITLIIKQHPVAGRVLIDPQYPHGFIYHPPENHIFSGTVSFKFALSDGTAVSETYTVEITVNNPPRFINVPEVIDCTSLTNLALTLQAVDPDTPATQLSFALKNAPEWLSIVNNNDGTALVSGTVPPTRDKWAVFAAEVSDPLSQATTRATLLLTFDPTASGVLLTVINGSGGTLATEGTVIQITARMPHEGETFMGWEGDVQYLDDPHSPTPTVTLPGHDITVTACFRSDTEPGSFANWAATHGLGAGESGPGDSPAGDGVSNLEKYAYGLDPRIYVNPAILFTMQIDIARECLVLRYEKSKDATDVQIIPVWTPSLTPPLWQSTPIETTIVNETATHEIWEAVLPMQPGRAFMRLKFEL